MPFRPRAGHGVGFMAQRSKLMVAQLVTEVPALYGTLMFAGVL